MAATRALVVLCVLRAVLAQQGGWDPEHRPSISIESCGSPGGCRAESVMITLDSASRELHNYDNKKCFDKGKWDADICPDPQTCATNCMLEGVTSGDYPSKHGVIFKGNALELKLVTGKEVGGRVYAMDGDDTYKLFHLKNREFAFDVDVNSLSCGLNAALYFVEMSANGGKGGGNGAGARYGTGYCDATCPREHFINGEANLLDWNASIGGKYGSCCTELDLFEANRMAASFAAHPCSLSSAASCQGSDCGPDGHVFESVCDKLGCDFNTYRMGDKGFYGPGLTVDTSKPFTVVTQFLTTDGSDQGDLAEIRRYFVQDGQVYRNPKVQGIPGVEGNSLTDAYCATSKEAFSPLRSKKKNLIGAYDQFNKKGGMKTMGESLDRGMVLVLSLWDDPGSAMRWLDSRAPSKLDDSVPGVARGPCALDAGEAEQVEEDAPDATARFSNIRYGPVGSTTEGLGWSEPLSAAATAPMPNTPRASAEYYSEAALLPGNLAAFPSGAALLSAGLAAAVAAAVALGVTAWRRARLPRPTDAACLERPIKEVEEDALVAREDALASSAA